MGWTHELDLASTPAHALGDRQVVERVFDDGRQQAGGRLADDHLAEAQFRAALVDFAQLNAAFFGKAKGCLGRVAFGIESGLAWRAVDIDAAVRLLGFQLGQQHGQTTRCGVDFFRAEFQTGCLQAFFNPGEECIS